MEGGQKTLLVIILIVIVVAGIIFTVRRAGRGTAKPPPRIAGEKIEKIDYKTGEFFTKTRRVASGISSGATISGLRGRTRRRVSTPLSTS